jgi:hypothetical protein
MRLCKKSSHTAPCTAWVVYPGSIDGDLPVNVLIEEVIVVVGSRIRQS